MFVCFFFVAHEEGLENGAVNTLVVSDSSTSQQPSQTSQGTPSQVTSEKQEEEEDDDDEEIGEIGGLPLLPIHNSHVKLEKVGKVILNLYNNATNYNKRQWASILAPILTYGVSPRSLFMSHSGINKQQQQQTAIRK